MGIQLGSDRAMKALFIKAEVLRRCCNFSRAILPSLIATSHDLYHKGDIPEIYQLGVTDMVLHIVPPW